MRLGRQRGQRQSRPTFDSEGQDPEPVEAEIIPPPSREAFLKYVPGARVEYNDNDGRIWTGTVRYVGPIAGKEDLSHTFIGVELDKPFGRNDGTVHGRSYFKCPPLCGVFTLPDRFTRH